MARIFFSCESQCKEDLMKRCWCLLKLTASQWLNASAGTNQRRLSTLQPCGEHVISSLRSEVTHSVFTFISSFPFTLTVFLSVCLFVNSCTNRTELSQTISLYIKSPSWPLMWLLLLLLMWQCLFHHITLFCRNRQSKRILYIFKHSGFAPGVDPYSVSPILYGHTTNAVGFLLPTIFKIYFSVFYTRNYEHESAWSIIAFLFII